MEKTYRLSRGFTIFFWILGIFCCLIVITLPLGILIIYLIFTAEVHLTHDMLERRWLGRKAVPLNEITELKWLPHYGLLQGQMRPLQVVAKNPVKKTRFGIPVGCFERCDEMIVEMQKRSGHTISGK